MKKNIKLLMGILVLIVVILISYILYQHLIDDYETDNLSIVDENTSIESVTDSDSDSDAEDDSIKKASDFNVLDNNGDEVSLSSFIGKPIVVNFWASWCSPCKGELPDFEDAYIQYGEEVEFMMINITDGTRETTGTVKDFISEQGYTFPVYFDVDLDASNTYEIYYIPTTYFIDSDGNIKAYSEGAIDADTLEEGIESILQ